MTGSILLKLITFENRHLHKQVSANPILCFPFIRQWDFFTYCFAISRFLGSKLLYIFH